MQATSQCITSKNVVKGVIEEHCPFSPKVPTLCAFSVTVFYAALHKMVPESTGWMKDCKPLTFLIFLTYWIAGEGQMALVTELWIAKYMPSICFLFPLNLVQG